MKRRVGLERRCSLEGVLRYIWCFGVAHSDESGKNQTLLDNLFLKLNSLVCHRMDVPFDTIVVGGWQAVR